MRSSVELTLPEVQRIAGTEGQIQTVLAGAREGVSQEELVAAIEPVLPGDVEVLTGEEAAAQLSSDVQEGFAFFQQALTIFGIIALVVGVFVISNTFAILLAQRTRELALLRAVGASRGQVLGSVMLEAVLVGLVSAVLGLLAGVGLAKLVTVALEAFGADLPTSNLVVRPATALIALVIGLVVTLIAALLPAIRATRVPPLAALRDVAIDRSGASKARIVLGIVVLVLGALNLSAAWTQDGDTDAIPTVGIGALLIVVGAIIIGPVLAGRSIKVIGGPLPRLKGVTGRLATENAAAQPEAHVGDRVGPDHRRGPGRVHHRVRRLRHRVGGGRGEPGLPCRPRDPERGRRVRGQRLPRRRRRGRRGRRRCRHGRPARLHRRGVHLPRR